LSILVTGAAGFVGSNFVRALISQGLEVIGVDNLSLGKKSNLDAVIDSKAFMFEELDLSDFLAVEAFFETIGRDRKVDEIWHFAANSDIQNGVADWNVDFNDTFLTTFNLVQCAERLSIARFFFSSSSAVYGDHGYEQLHEGSGPLLPISNYGAMKLASEAVIAAASEKFLSAAVIFRFPNVIGLPATHGVIFDLIQRLKGNRSELHVLGNGTQQKIYLHVDDLISAMLFVSEHSHNKLEVFNIGPEDDGVSVSFIASEVVSVVAPTASIVFGCQNKGWIGDVPRFRFRIDKLKNLGWSANASSSAAIRKAVREIAGASGMDNG
jgi:UDP-glucose 4-epimerase